MLQKLKAFIARLRKKTAGVAITAGPGAVILSNSTGHKIAMTPGLAEELAKVLPRYAETARRKQEAEA